VSEPVPIAVKASALHRRFPDYDALRRRARARMPTFAYDYVDTGVGTEHGVARNAAALDALDMVPRFGATPPSPATTVGLFGRRYVLPVGVAPMGLMSLAWPGAEAHLARAAQEAKIPFVLATGAAMSIEQAAALAPDVFWFQLYHFTGGDIDIDFDLVRRAEAAGAHVLVLTIDGAARPKRHRDLRNGLVPPFRLNPRMALQAACAPAWLAALVRHGVPLFENVCPYLGGKADAWATAAFMVEHASSVFSWDDVARIRAHWPRALVVKGLLHPADAEKAVALGADGVWLSNHGGRMFDPAPATIALLPAIAAAVGNRATVLMDSGVRGGHDVMRARALGADAVFAGRAFLFATAALGQAGGRHMIEIFADEIRNTLSFLGAADIDGVDASVVWRP
jgi:isopentenyl diphosphate isomerase/L-lactate dehydrogenase-like FMN-dependent dehydrogenase